MESLIEFKEMYERADEDNNVFALRTIFVEC